MPFKKGEPNPGKKWQKGISPNPGGLTKEVAAARDRARAKAAMLSPRAVQALGGIMKSPGEHDGPAVSAAKEILDRGLGKTPQTVTVGITLGEAVAEIRSFIGAKWPHVLVELDAWVQQRTTTS